MKNKKHVEYFVCYETNNEDWATQQFTELEEAINIYNQRKNDEPKKVWAIFKKETTVTKIKNI